MTSQTKNRTIEISIQCLFLDTVLKMALQRMQSLL